MLDLTEGENCTAAMDGVDEVIRRTNILSSVNARDRVHRISVAAVPCLAGLVCRRESLNVGVCMAESGEKITRHRRGPIFCALL